MSARLQGFGIWAGYDKTSGGLGEYAVRIQNNTIRDVGATSGGGIVLVSNNGTGGGGTGRVEATVTGNSVDELGRNAFTGLYAQIGGACLTDNGTLGLNITNNYFDASSASVRQQFDRPRSGVLARALLPARLCGATRRNGEFNIFGAAGTASANLDTFRRRTNNNTLTNGPVPDHCGRRRRRDHGDSASPAPPSSCCRPILAAVQAGEDWEAAVREWFANLPQPGSGDSGPGTGDPGAGDGDSGSGDGNPGAGDPPPPAETPHPVIVDDGVLSQAELDYLVEAAIQRWIDAGATPEQVAEMRATAISVGHMTGAYLGSSTPDAILIDSDGAGHGWFLDRTPGDDGEFGGIGSRLTADAGGPADGRMDLLTVLMHELGHQLGLDDLYSTADANEVMYGYGRLGERRLAQTDDLVGADLTHAGHEAFTEILPTIPVLPAGKAVRILFESTVEDYFNQLVPTGQTNFSTLNFSGVPGSPVISNSNALVNDSLTLGNLVFDDVNGNGVFDGTDVGIDSVTLTLFADTNNDGLFDGGDTQLATTTTAGGGLYSFAGLSDGNYIVRVDAGNFTGGGALVGLITTTGSADPDNDVNNDDNGAAGPGGSIVSQAISLDFDSETVLDGTGKLDINDTLDFGFLGLNSAPVNTVGGDVNLDEDDFNVALTGMSVTDAEANPATDDIIVTLAVGNGLLDISTIVVGGVTAGDVTGDGTPIITITATLNEINATLAAAGGLTYSPNANFFGTDVLTFTTNDNGFSGVDPGLTGDATSEEDIDTRNLIVAPVNDAPEGTDDTISAPLNLEYVFASAEFGFTDPVENDGFLAVVFTGVSGGALFVDTGADGFDPGDEVTVFPVTVSVTDIDAGRVAFVPDTAGTGTGTVNFRVQDDGGTANSGVDTDPTDNLLTFDVIAPNPPVLTDFGGDTSTFTEGGAAVLLDDSSAPELAASLADNQTDLDGGSLTVSVTANGVAAEDVLGISTAGTVTLSSGTNVGSIVSVGGLAIGTISSDGNGGDDLVVDFDTADATPAAITTLIQSLTYANSNNGDPSTLARTVQVSIDDGEFGVETESVTVNVVGVNDEPTLSATGQNPTYTEGGTSADLFGTVAASTVEAGQTFTSLTLTVTNVTDGAAEVLTVDGSDITLTNGSSFFPTATNGLNVSVTVVAGLATVTVTGGTLSQAALETLVDTLSYRNTSENPTDADRVVTITSLSDDGSNTAPNDNTSALSISSTVNVEPVDDAPTTGNDTNTVNEDGLIDNANVFTNDDDIDGPPLEIDAVNGSTGNVDTQISLLSGALLTVTSGGLYDYDPNDAFNYLISAATAAATGAVNTSATDGFNYDLVGGTGPATVTITINGVDSADDELWGDAGNNTITDTVDVDVFDLSQGGDDSAFGQAGDDIIYFGAEFTPADSVDGGANATLVGDALVLEGDYATTQLVLGATSLVNVETIITLGGFDYDIVSNDANVAADETLTVFGGDLGALDTLVFDGSAESDGRFVLIGGAGNDELTGGDRDDRLFGGAGDNDLDGGAGNGDTLDYRLAAGAVVVDLGAGVATDNGFGDTDLLAGIENVVGTDFDDSLTGDVEINVLDGGLGADTLTGGDGSDSYVVDNVGDQVVETSAAGGVDIVRSSVSFTLGANVDNLDLVGLGNINGTGNDDANTITGNVGNNILNGGLGADFLRGGFGNDTYVVDNAGDAINEFLGQGTADAVQSSISYTLGLGLENLTLTGVGAIDGTGNIFANTLIGNANANVLDGKAGADAMNGGLGSDTYIVDNVGDTVTETSAVGGTDEVQSSATFTLGSNIENLVLTGLNAVNGTGNASVNILTGNAAANVLDGKGGADTMTGGLGNDTYVIDNVGDVAVELAGEGTDTIQTSVTATLAAEFENLTLTGTGNVNGTGNGANNVLTGNSGANTLNGLIGADTMIGNGGNDVYVVDNGLDQVIETAGGGTDTVNSSISYTLAAEIENLTLTGVAAINGAGNGLANTITGNDANNVLTGGLGADTLKGGLGDDTYVVDNAGDSVSDLAGQGTDTVLSSVSYTLGGATENLNLTGTDAINATGSIFANVLNGNSNANILNGGGGADTMNAGLGNDTYIVDNAGDVVIETSVVGGTDEVQSSVNFTLGSNIENLTLTGASAVNGTGNALANVLTGNGQANILNGQANDDTLNGAGGADHLHGGLGNDSLEGGLGNDGFYFENALIASNVDDVLDFTAVNDTFFLDDAVFTTLAAGTLAAGAFVAGNTALDADDRILYDSATGELFYDADGSGGGSSAVLFATVNPGTAITNVDFVVF